MADQMQYPEHDRLMAVKDKSHAIGTFIDWLKENGIYLAQYTEERGFEDFLVPTSRGIQDLLAEHFNINLNNLENEKRAMIEELRKGSMVLDK